MIPEISTSTAASTRNCVFATRLIQLSIRLGFDNKRIQAAIDFANLAHAGQMRSGNGLPYVSHPLAVALLLAEAQLSECVVVAALLHDVKEDAPYLADRVLRDFGPRVDQMVSLLTKDATIVDKTVRAAEARARIGNAVYAEDDLDVGMIKLADRVHNTHTSAHLSAAKRAALMAEAISFYVPMARFVGWRDVASWLTDEAKWDVLPPLTVKR